MKEEEPEKFKKIAFINDIFVTCGSDIHSFECFDKTIKSLGVLREQNIETNVVGYRIFDRIIYKTNNRGVAFVPFQKSTEVYKGRRRGYCMSYDEFLEYFYDIFDIKMPVVKET